MEINNICIFTGEKADSQDSKNKYQALENQESDVEEPKEEPEDEGRSEIGVILSKKANNIT